MYLHRDDEMKKPFCKVREVPFIKHNEKLCKISDVRDHRVNFNFFTTFCQDSVLPAVWQDETIIIILESLGLCTRVTTTEWFQAARDFAGFSFDNILHKSEVLLGKLNDIIKDHTSNLGNLALLFEAISHIEFVYFPQGWRLNRILCHIFPDWNNSRSNASSLIKLGGSVSFYEADLACLCKSVLPESCEPLINNSVIRNALHIEAPVYSSKTVTENLNYLCRYLNVTCTRLHATNPEHVKNLVEILEMHYACLSSMKPPPDILSDFEDMMCILLSSTPSLLQWVKPSQLVMQLPSGCSLQTYWYKALQKCVELLTIIGVRQELKAQYYININPKKFFQTMEALMKKIKSDIMRILWNCTMFKTREQSHWRCQLNLVARSMHESCECPESLHEWCSLIWGQASQWL